MTKMYIEGEAISRFGVIDAEAVSDGVYRIKDIVEKPPFAEAPSDLAIIGRYILTPAIFPEIEQTRALCGTFSGNRHDAGDKLGFLIATVEFALKRPDLAPEFVEYLRSLKL